MKISLKILPYLLPYIFISVFNYYFAKLSLEYSSPFVFNLFRYLISSTIFYLMGGKLIINKRIISLSIFTSLSSLLWAFGLLYVSPSESAVLSYSMPLFSIPISYFILKENSSKIVILGAIIGFLGVTLYGLPLIMSHFVVLGAIYTLINAIFWALFSVLYRALKDADPKNVNFTQFLFGSIFFLIGSAFDFKLDPSQDFFIGILYTALPGGALAFFLWNLMLRIEKVPRVTVMAFSIPILTTVFDIFLDGISLLPMQILGIALMFIGILLSRIRKL
ncbi:MAG: DMT family transporter [Sulfolobaceae archaeon]|nr:DMT family transporter [Sulfolobaceae archaeon]